MVDLNQERYDTTIPLIVRLLSLQPFQTDVGLECLHLKDLSLFGHPLSGPSSELQLNIGISRKRDFKAPVCRLFSLTEQTRRKVTGP